MFDGHRSNIKSGHSGLPHQLSSHRIDYGRNFLGYGGRERATGSGARVSEMTRPMDEKRQGSLAMQDVAATRKIPAALSES